MPPIGPAHQFCPRGRPAVRLLVIASALAGLFTMHGLADHGGSAQEMPTHPISTAAMSIGQTDRASDPTPTAMADTGATGQDPARHSSGMALAGLCLAVLAGAIVGFTLLRPNRTRLSARAKTAWHWWVPLAALRDRDPPCLFELSTLRT
jgi:hypothetical protein